MQVIIVADRGTHLLICAGSRYAVIEQRGDHYYNCHDHQRRGIPASQLADVATILDDSDWTSREAAQATFDQVVARGNQLAQRML